ncbi:unnamed protein product [Cyprideis torosa]|uniref:Uncharacterized protein n=1 Tax=Cyprideis torosa TaxID=163714 RepID=A0A7R8ZYD5_9CRUS|nr:unnamed protein product [Cyprideis torosa]CAG0908204.1 unnamed protein product [Cyprideis torosa]
MQSLDETLNFTKLEDSEVSSDPNDFSRSGETLPLPDITPGSMGNKYRTSGLPDQMEVNENEGTVRKRMKSKGHCQQKKHFACAVCSKSLSTKQRLQSHEFTHTGGKPFACKTHTLIHTGEKPFTCGLCGKSFARSCYLSSHKLIHTGKKAFGCRVCGKAFAQSSALSSHTLIHSGEKPFTCRICGKSFRRNGDLSTHTLIHTGEKPFACRTCGKSFAQSGHLRTHELTQDLWKRIW